MRRYPQFSFWILIAPAKICFYHIVVSHTKKALYYQDFFTRLVLFIPSPKALTFGKDTYIRDLEKVTYTHWNAGKLGFYI